MVNYIPHRFQEAFHRDRYRVFARLISAGTGGGKTKAGWYETFLWAFEHPGCVGYIFEPNNKMIRRILLPSFEDVFGKPPESCPLVKQYKKIDNCITWIYGNSKTWLVGLDEPEYAEGGNIDYAWPDEYRLVGGSGPSRHHKQETAWRVIVRRLRGSVPGKYPTGLWITTTPDEPGSVLHAKFEDAKTRAANSKIYRWSIFDNPYLTDVYRDEVVRSHSGGLAQRFVYGQFATVALGSFQFDYSVHVISDVPVVRHVVYGVDFGWSNPSCILTVGLDGDGRAYVLDEFYQNRVHDETLVSELKTMQAQYGDGAIICDRSSPQTIDNFCLAGLNAQANKGKREETIREIGGRLQRQEDGKTRLYVHERCVNLISELQVYDESKKEFDHAVDALRYALSTVMVSGAPQALVGNRGYW